MEERHRELRVGSYNRMKGNEGARRMKNREKGGRRRDGWGESKEEEEGKKKGEIYIL